MNIHAGDGARVRFVYPRNGYAHDKILARQHLTLGALYTVSSTHVHDFHTDVYLREVPGACFNSVHFEDEPTTDTVAAWREHFGILAEASA